MRFSYLLLALTPAVVVAQDPVKWTAKADPAKVAPGGHVLITMEAAIEPGWHLYSVTTPPGPIPTKIRLMENPRASAVKLYQPKPNKKFDPNFQAESETYDEKVAFVIEAEVAGSSLPGPLDLVAQARYQACNEKTCLRQKTKTATATVEVDAAAKAAAPKIPDGYMEAPLAAAPASTSLTPAPVAKSAPAKAAVPKANDGLLSFLALAFSLGLAAIFTPCVFPMIPFTMSYFLNRQGGSRGNSILQAVTFCLGIVVLFTGIGLVTTALLGPFGVIQLGSNPWVNTFIGGLFVLFGLSMLGAFEITLPSSLLTRLNTASERGGIGGSLLMGLTFSLTSFACVGPFMGTLLASSVQGDRTMPILGMATFASGLATPFFFLAMFPSLLTRLPKSGGWLPRVKVTMGFVVLAIAFKYFSNVDQVMQWNLLGRGLFLSIWIVLFALPGLYLLGLIKLEGVDPNAHLGVTRTLFAAAFLIFAVSLWPGLSCGRLGEVDAYVPACAEGPGGVAGVAAGPKWLKDDFKGAIERAKAEGKFVLVSFTGYACTNCHWMKANMFPRPEIAAALGDFILVELYTDGSDAASLENQKLQETRFKTVAIPHYVILDGNENVLASSVGRTTDTKEFLGFLTTPKQTKAARL
ncbi:MAG: cytochrome c biogenesis protein CcdA [Bryobacteraceae bacterium]